MRDPIPHQRGMLAAAAAIAPGGAALVVQQRSILSAQELPGGQAEQPNRD